MTYCTTYCNQAHDLKTGKPVGHACYVIPPAALAAEINGDFAKAIDLIAAGKTSRQYGEPSLRPHSGIKQRTLKHVM